jgi:hypothetical protein
MTYTLTDPATCRVALPLDDASARLLLHGNVGDVDMHLVNETFEALHVRVLFEGGRLHVFIRQGPIPAEES